MNNINLLIYLLTFLFFVFIVLKWFYKKYYIKRSHRWRRKSSTKALNKIKLFENNGQIFSYLRKIEPFVVEELILDALNQRTDIKVIRNKRYTGDNGIDGCFYLKDDLENKFTYKHIIQVKRYSSYINKNHIIDFIEQIKKEKATLGLFVHTSKTSDNIRELIKYVLYQLLNL